MPADTAEDLRYEPAILQLQQRFGERCSTAPAVREHHAKGECWIPAQLPDAVVYALTTEEVADAVKICAAHDTPIIAFGTGTSLEGHVNAVKGGVCLDVSGMQEVLEVNNEDLDCRVQAGVTRNQLNEHLRDTGLFFPIDPGADASLGGMAATRASGTNAVRYGTMREVVLGLTVVLADGRVIRTGGRARKSSAGYDLTRLFVGSEGTLGIITEVQLKLFGIPESITSAVCQYPDLESAVNTVILTIQSGIPVARIELLDSVQMQCSIDYSKLEGFAAAPTLFFEFHGTEASAREQADQVRTISDEFGGAAFQWAERTEDRNKMWKARHDAYWAVVHSYPGKQALSTDACVPISRLAECIMETCADVERSGLTAPIVGHVGDGNFHVLLMFDADGEEQAEAMGIVERLNRRAIAMGGTCTGEHGIGMGKIRYLAEEHGEGVAVMGAVKQALDPANILNPGKIIRL